jgi:hypothetical protein
VWEGVEETRLNGIKNVLRATRSSAPILSSSETSPLGNVQNAMREARYRDRDKSRTL